MVVVVDLKNLEVKRRWWWWDFEGDDGDFGVGEDGGELGKVGVM